MTSTKFMKAGRVMETTNITLLSICILVHTNCPFHGKYRVRQVVVTWVELILIRDVPLPVSFCLGSWKFGRMGWGASKD